MFRVVPDQLRISEGWVRCGHCDEVFDANAHLRSLETTAAISSPAPQVSEPSISTSGLTDIDVVPAADAEVYDWGPMLEPQSVQLEKSASIAPKDLAENFPQETSEPLWDLPSANTTHQGPMDFDHTTAYLYQPPSDLPADAALEDSHFAPTTVGDWAYQSPVPQEAVPDPTSNTNEEAAPSFMLRSRQRTKVDHYLGHKAMLSLSIVLALLLISQFLFFERDRLAASSPELRLPLAYGCEFLGCAISAPRHIESMAIDNSAFTHVKPGVYNLSLSLQNSASIDLAAPALELTLTDLQDQTLLRRVILPGQYSENKLIGSRAELVANVPIAVRAGEVSEKISGYRLLVFYP
jgi:predicted Zn finger-like uncharacterized protein